MNVWVINRKKYRPVQYLLAVGIYTVNIALVSVSIYFFFCIMCGWKADWNTEAIQFGTQEDVFLADRSESVLLALFITFLFLVVFSTGIVMGYRRLQLMAEVQEIKVFGYLGYEKKLLWWAAAQEQIADILIAMPFAMLLFFAVLQQMAGNRMFQRILTLGGSAWIVEIVSVLYFVLLAIIQNGLFVKHIGKEKNKIRKYSEGILFALMTFSIIICVTLNSLVCSLDSSLRNIVEKPMGRLLEVLDNEGLMEKRGEEIEKLDVTGEVIHLVPYLAAEWEDTEGILYSKSAGVNLVSFFKGMTKYGIEGKYENLKEGEILIPEYLYGLGDYSVYEYTSGAELIGKNISMKLHNYFNDRDYEYTFTVVGTYDNISASCMNDLFYINDIQADSIYTDIHEDVELEIEKLKAEYSEELKENPTMFDDYYTKHYMGIYISEGHDVRKAQHDIEELMGWKTFLMQEPNDTILEYYEMIMKIGDIIMWMLFSVTLANLIITLTSDMKKRQKETATYYALGYNYFKLISMFTMEKIRLFVRSFMVGILVTGGIIAGGNLIIQKCLPFYRRTIVLNYDWGMVGKVCLLVLTATVMSLGITYIMVKKMNLAETLSKEE